MTNIRLMNLPTIFIRSEKLYLASSALFCVIAIFSNIITAKLFPSPIDAMPLPAGLITFPLSFFLGAFVTEIFGTKKALYMILLSFFMTLAAYLIIILALALPATDNNLQVAFERVFSLSGIILGSSVAAFAISQCADVQFFAFLKKRAQGRKLWLRANASTLCALLIDTAIVNTGQLYYGQQLDLSTVLKITSLSFTYKILVSILSTPLFYLAVTNAKILLRKELSTSTVLQ
jgi:uncharacterized integral membrane protein (TIGR00697 family)